jgi:hypothetical protein
MCLDKKLTFHAEFAFPAIFAFALNRLVQPKLIRVLSGRNASVPVARAGRNPIEYTQNQHMAISRGNEK